jgi:DNA-binding NtrC family response regulator
MAVRAKYLDQVGDEMGQMIEIEAGAVTLAAAERVLIEATLARFGGHRERTAVVLGISLKTLYNRLRQYAAEDAGEACGVPRRVQITIAA